MKVGEWVYCEFELGQIVAMEGQRITEFSDGSFRHGSYDLVGRCFPLSVKLKLISEEYAYWNSRLHKEGANGLNYPDIHRWLVEHWVKTCAKPDNKEWRKQRYEELARFCEGILDKCQDFKHASVCGVRLGR